LPPQHNGQLPSTSQDRSEFKKLVQSKERNLNEENFEEAYASAFRAFNATKVLGLSFFPLFLGFFFFLLFF